MWYTRWPIAQANLNSALLDDVDFTVPPFLDVLPGGRDGAPQQRTGSAGPRQGERQWAQPPRMWVSAEGSVSPAHFDNSPSILTQVPLRCAPPQTSGTPLLMGDPLLAWVDAPRQFVCGGQTGGALNWRCMELARNGC